MNEVNGSRLPACREESGDRLASLPGLSHTIKIIKAQAQIPFRASWGLEGAWG